MNVYLDENTDEWVEEGKMEVLVGGRIYVIY